MYVGTRTAIPKAIIIIIIGHGTFNALLLNTTSNSTVVMVITSLQVKAGAGGFTYCFCGKIGNAK